MNLILCTPCPVAVTEKFLQRGGHEQGRVIWRHILSTKSGLKHRNALLMYSCASNLFKQALMNEGLNAKEHGLHSL